MMLKALQSWLNGTRDYNMGVSLFRACNLDKSLLPKFEAGYSLWNNYKLQELLKQECRRLKDIKTASVVMDTGVAIAKSFTDDQQYISQLEKTVEGIKAALHNPNSELQQSVKEKADLLYKEAMNTRAALFASIPDLSVTDGNRPEQIEFRQPLALKSLQLYLEASDEYERLDYVRIHGRLDDSEPPKPQEDEVPDHMVKQALDNARKAKNKLALREQTPERVQLIQDHEKKIKILEERWHSLQSQKTP